MLTTYKPVQGDMVPLIFPFTQVQEHLHINGEKVEESDAGQKWVWK